MTQEEKARAYDEAIKRARKINSGEGVEASPDWTICEVIFPELKVSKDEMIRKALIDGFTVMKESKNCGKTFSNHNIPVADILAWLEKQGEPNPYSGTSFEHDGHIWGMCARDNGVDIIFDGELKAFISSWKQ